MKFLESIKKYFSTQEAPYNWGASIEHLKKKIDDIDHRSSVQIRGLSDNINMSCQELEQRQASYFNSVGLALGATIDSLKNKIAKLEKDLKKLKAKPNKKVAK